MAEHTLTLVPELSVEETIRRQYNNGLFEIVLDMAFTGQDHTTPSGHGTEKILFLLIETIKEDEGYPRKVGDITVCTIYYSVRDNKIAYRSYGEEAGPFARSCPMKFLQQLTPTTNELALEWRSECWQFWQKYAQWVAPRWQNTPGKVQDLFLAMYLSKAKTVVCFHEGLFYWLEWTGEIARYTEPQEGLSLRCSRVWRTGISNAPADFAIQNSSLETVVYRLTTGVERHIPVNVPITHGWIALDIVHEG